jgi:site-specific DNA-adenine methylase
MNAGLKPLFPFYGSKWRDAKRYAAPDGLVIEPFAGSAGYSVYWGVRRAKLFDVDPIIVGLWQYLIRVTEEEIMSLPDLEVGQSVDAFNLPQEARWLIGFWLNRGSAQPKKTKTAFSDRTERAQLVWSLRARQRIASQLHGIREWTIEQRSFESVPNESATWFIDPPYVDKGRYYRFRDVDYVTLARWSCERLGQVFVCEQVGATWLPFEPLAIVKSTKGTSAEAVYRQNAPATQEDFFRRAAE